MLSHRLGADYNRRLARCNRRPTPRPDLGPARRRKGPVVISKLIAYLQGDPVKAVALMAALVAIASTPIAFAILGRLDWFKARRGRVMMKPAFSSIVVGMMLVMGIPAIFAAMVVKSEDFDKNRYEFDPNKTWSVLEQGRQFSDVQKADEAVREEMKRLALERKNLVDSVKKLDEAMLTLRAASGQSPPVAQTVPAVLERLAAVRRSVGLDGPQQLMDFKAPPASLSPGQTVVASVPGPGAMTNATPPSQAPTTKLIAGLTRPEADAELATVPEPQRSLASMLPMDDLPEGWTVAKYGPRHLETFNADNLFEKIDGRAESFTQNNVTGMAYASYHPTGDESNEVQVYIFEFDHSKDRRAQGKYIAEKPEQSEAVKVGTEGYTSAGSLLFFADPFYTQIVSTKDDARFAAFSMETARRIAARQMPDSGPAGDGSPKPAKPATMADAVIALLPAQDGRGTPTLVASDVFGYGFLSEVFMADYKDGSVTWQGFLRPYHSPEEAKGIFEKYVASARQNGGEPRMVEAEGADQMYVSASVGLVDAVFRKGNVIGGANGATDSGNVEANAVARAEAFARSFVKSLPADLPRAAPAEKKPASPPPGEEG